MTRYAFKYLTLKTIHSEVPSLRKVRVVYKPLEYTKQPWLTPVSHLEIHSLYMIRNQEDTFPRQLSYCAMRAIAVSDWRESEPRPVSGGIFELRSYHWQALVALRTIAAIVMCSVKLSWVSFSLWLNCLMHVTKFKAQLRTNTADFLHARVLLNQSLTTTTTMLISSYVDGLTVSLSNWSVLATFSKKTELNNIHQQVSTGDKRANRTNGEKAFSSPRIIHQSKIKLKRTPQI